MKKSMLIGAIIFGVIVVGGIIVGVSLGSSNNDDMEIGTNTTNNTSISNEKESDLYNMEKIQAGKYSFLVPDNGDSKFANGDSFQNFYTKDDESSTVWYSIEGPLSIPTNKKEAKSITSTLGTVTKFEYDKNNGIEQAFIINKYDDGDKIEYQGVRLVSNLNDSSDCIWLSVTGNDDKIIEKILNSLEW